MIGYESKTAFDDWAERIVSLEPDLRAGIVAYATRLAADRRVPKSDRDFAKAQADAIERAIKSTQRASRIKRRMK
jgi:hypothetical protein